MTNRRPRIRRETNRCRSPIEAVPPTECPTSSVVARAAPGCTTEDSTRLYRERSVSSTPQRMLALRRDPEPSCRGREENHLPWDRGPEALSATTAGQRPTDC